MTHIEYPEKLHHAWKNAVNGLFEDGDNIVKDRENSKVFKRIEQQYGCRTIKIRIFGPGIDFVSAEIEFISENHKAFFILKWQ